MKSTAMAVLALMLGAVPVALSTKPPKPGKAAEKPVPSTAGPLQVKAVLSRAGDTDASRRVFLLERPRECEDFVARKYETNERMITLSVEWRAGWKADEKQAEVVLVTKTGGHFDEEPAGSATVEVTAAPDDRQSAGKMKLVAAFKGFKVEYDVVVNQCE